VFSFALRPEENQPSGTCNFSRLQEATLLINKLNANQSSKNSYPATGWWENGSNGSWATYTGTPNLGAIVIYAVNYNILKITSGMGGLIFAH